jgi:hypothetical protein
MSARRITITFVAPDHLTAQAVTDAVEDELTIFGLDDENYVYRCEVITPSDAE